MTRHDRHVGQHDLAAIYVQGFGWRVTIDGTDWASGLEERVALAILDGLAKLYPDSCPVCGRYVRTINGKRAPHNSDAPAPGRKPRRCPGGGMAVAS